MTKISLYKESCSLIVVFGLCFWRVALTLVLECYVWSTINGGFGVGRLRLNQLMLFLEISKNRFWKQLIFPRKSELAEPKIEN